MTSGGLPGLESENQTLLLGRMLGTKEGIQVVKMEKEKGFGDQEAWLLQQWGLAC